jgi:hypothetical protein
MYDTYTVRPRPVKLIKHHAMKMYEEWRYSSTILDLGT